VRRNLSYDHLRQLVLDTMKHTRHRKAEIELLASGPDKYHILMRAEVDLSKCHKSAVAKDYDKERYA
jgi:sarcosine oxidase gamma subunit